MKKIALILLIAFVGLSLTEAFAAPGGKGGKGGKGNTFNRSACKRTANNARNTCIRACQGSFQEDQKICNAQDLAKKQCLEACYATRDACVTAAKKSLTECLDEVTKALDADLAKCTMTDAAELFACQNEARVKAFSATLSCQSQFKLNEAAQTALKACTTAARECNQACKNAASPVPTATPTSTPTIG